eukprot:jgi/Ulvmu1/11199/UM072_0035.1
MLKGRFVAPGTVALDANGLCALCSGSSLTKTEVPLCRSASITPAGSRTFDALLIHSSSAHSLRSQPIHSNSTDTASALQRCGMWLDETSSLFAQPRGRAVDAAGVIHVLQVDALPPGSFTQASLS